MDPVVALHQSVKEKFPALSVRADAFHKKRWEDMLDIGAEYAWFEALADALNDEMRRGIPYQTHRALFEYLAGAYTAGSTAVKQRSHVDERGNVMSDLMEELPGRLVGGRKRDAVRCTTNGPRPSWRLRARCRARRCAAWRDHAGSRPTNSADGCARMVIVVDIALLLMPMTRRQSS